LTGAKARPDGWRWRQTCRSCSETLEHNRVQIGATPYCDDSPCFVEEFSHEVRRQFLAALEILAAPPAECQLKAVLSFLRIARLPSEKWSSLKYGILEPRGGFEIGRKQPEEIMAKLRQVDVLTTQGEWRKPSAR
jgi:hypothetical protein